MLAELAMIAVTVMPGNTMSGIAQSHGVSLAAVEQANPQVSNPNLIYAGQTLNVPTGHGTVTVTVHHGDGDNDADDGAPGLPEHNASPSSIAPAYHAQPSRTTHHRHYSPPPRQSLPQSSSVSSSGISIPGMPQSLANCIWFRESTNGTNPAAHGNQFGIIPASGHNVAGMSVAQQEQVAGQIYASVGGRAWAADGCPGT